MVKVLSYGAGKYGDRNWENGLVFGRVFAATMRHLWAWWRGEEKDEESGISHLSHATCNLFFLATYQSRGTGSDDRPPVSTSYPEAETTEEPAKGLLSPKRRGA